MARRIGIGNQDFEKIRINNYFYIDKTKFIREWWESGDEVTLITRPRRFGKTLNMSMLEKFFSIQYAGRGDLFEGLSIWKEKFSDGELSSGKETSSDKEMSLNGETSPDKEMSLNGETSPDKEMSPKREISPDGKMSPDGNYKYKKIQGTYPVLFISFAGIKETSFVYAHENICRMIEEQYNKHDYLLDSGYLNDKEKDYYQKVRAEMSDSVASVALRNLSDFLFRYYGKKVIILLDEYDTPMQEAFVGGYWKEMTAFIRSLFNFTFKTNPYLERAVMTGITRVSKESIFSDLNNLKVVSATSEKYTDCFGFTEEEVFAALKEYGLFERAQQVKEWYDGFTFGGQSDIYNPWSIINFLDDERVGLYWANTSSNGLVGKLIREGDSGVKKTFERLIQGESIHMEIDEQIIYDQLSTKKNAIWSLLLASGYLKVKNYQAYTTEYGLWKEEYELALTNLETRIMFVNMVRGWFDTVSSDYNGFIRALITDDIKAMNVYMNRVSSEMFSSFDTGKGPSERQPERFYHGFVLGLMVELVDRYVVTSNRESGLGRYDVMLEPRSAENDAILLEFKVQDEGEKELSDTVKEAIRQIEEKDYQGNLIAKGIPKERIRKYGFAFCGKKVLIGSGSVS